MRACLALLGHDGLSVTELRVFDPRPQIAYGDNGEGKTPVAAPRENNHEGYLLVIRPQDVHLLSSLAKDYEALPIREA
jgi:hypothetical protein